VKIRHERTHHYEAADVGCGHFADLSLGQFFMIYRTATHEVFVFFSSQP